MDKMREQFVSEMHRLEVAIAKTKSEYLKKDYQRALRRMKRELADYDSFRNGGGRG